MAIKIFESVESSCLEVGYGGSAPGEVRDEMR